MLLSTVCFYSPERLIDNRCDSGLVLVICLISLLCFWTLFCHTLTDITAHQELQRRLTGPRSLPFSFACVHSSGGGVKPWNRFFNEALLRAFTLIFALTFSSVVQRRNVASGEFHTEALARGALTAFFWAVCRSVQWYVAALVCVILINLHTPYTSGTRLVCMNAALDVSCDRGPAACLISNKHAALCAVVCFRKRVLSAFSGPQGAHGWFIWKNVLVLQLNLH